MKHFRMIVFAFLVGAVVVVAGTALSGQPTTRYVDANFNDLVDRFRVAEYLSGAIKLQALEAQARAARLREIANDPADAEAAIIYCRMLFEAKHGELFRRPQLGAPNFVGRADMHAPLEPIEIYEGIPVLIVRGYTLGGIAEPPVRYLDYCLEHCRWRDAKYQAMDQARINQLLDKFASGFRDVADQEFIRNQGK
jgi:hypothetical protein